MGLGPTTRFHRAMNDHFVTGSLTCLKPETLHKRASGTFPLILNIEPTNACNAKCYYCPRESTVEQVGTHYMDWDLYKRLIDECADHPQLIMINYHKDGESLLHPDFPKMIAYAREKNVAETLHVNTNGILLGKPRARELLEAGIQDITVSIDAATAPVYEKLKRVRGFDHLEEAVRSFISYRDKIGADTFIRVKIMEFDDITPEDIQTFHERWDGIADMVQVTGVHDWSGEIEDFAITDYNPPEQFACSLLWYMLAVNSNGQVSICNVDWNYSGVSGDFNKHSLQDIWQGARQTAIRKSHLAGTYGQEAAVCKGCVIGASCGDNSQWLQTSERFK